MNIWDWNIDNSYEFIQMRNASRLEIQLNMDEELIKDLVAKRSPLEKTKLFFRRIFTIIVSMVILCGGWTLIMLVNMYDNRMISYLNQYGVLKYVSSFFPSLLLSIINNVVPLTIKQITFYEAWDF